MTQEKQKKALPIDFAAVADFIEGQAKYLDGAIKGGDDSFERNMLPEEYPATEEAMPVSFGSVFPFFMPLAMSSLGVLYNFKRRIRTYKTTAPPELFAELEQFALEQGASAIGYAEITPDLQFKGHYIPHRHAIVIVSEMRQENMKNAPSIKSVSEIAKAYGDTTKIGNKLTRFLRKQGYSAYGGMSLGGAADHVRLAEKAGLGAIGYHGSLISPQDGARLRINVVYTSIENLPYPDKNEHLWVRDFCAVCNKCIRKCPPQAIYSSREPDEYGRVAAIDDKKCGPYMANHMGCGVCIVICPFSIAGYDKVQQGFRRRKNKNNAQ